MKFRFWLVLAVSGLPSSMTAQQRVQPLLVDASGYTEPTKTTYTGGTSRTPDGHVLGMNSLYLTLDGKPWLPTMGEFHYTRVPEALWEQEILKMKAAGIDIISTYIFWIHHEEVKGQFDWSGDRDLRYFVELCARHHMYVYLRIGPWAHGEARNGGFPDWLLTDTKTQRVNDPDYLNYVDVFFKQIAAQVSGMFWKDGGPIIGVQLENEYGRRGPNAGEAHILELKRMAVADGFDVPLYSVTGWDKAVIPKGAALAVFGGYPDAPWGASLKDLPPQELYEFRFNSRVAGNMGAIGSTVPENPTRTYDFPFLTAEMGGGVESTYHRRPVIRPNDITAVMPVMLGSGVNLYGWYMFQGGENPDGKLTTLQESQATNYPTDVPVKNYDFQAPLGPYGRERSLLRQLKVYNYFLQSFGSDLAPMEPHAPNLLPSGPGDLSVARIAVRSRGDRGYLFFSNYVRGATMPARRAFQVRIKLAHVTVNVPEQPTMLPSGSYGIWPVNLKVGAADLRYATAQLMTRTEDRGQQVYYFVETPGVEAEFVWAQSSVLSVQAANAVARKHGEVWSVSHLRPSLRPAMTVVTAGGERIQVVLLSAEQAQNTWRLGENASAEERPGALLVTSAQFFADQRAVTLQSFSPDFRYTLLGRADLIEPDNGTEAVKAGATGDFTNTQPAEKVTVHIQQTAKAGAVPPVKLGPKLAWRQTGVAIAPGDSAFALAGKWEVEIPEADWHDVDDLFLTVRYDGDVARLVSGNKLLADNFYSGQPWQVGLKRFREQIAKAGLQLEILPRHKDAPIYVQGEEGKQVVWNKEQVCDLLQVSIDPEYRLEIRRGDSQR